MADISLNTRIDEIQMPDKLRTRLKMSHCNTFQQAMELDYSKWENVSGKVINAMKRFKDTYSDAYSVLLTKGEESQPTPVILADQPTDQRRFYVANNILNAYVSAGKLIGNGASYDSVMREIMRATDAFMEAYNSKTEIKVSVPDMEIEPAQPQGTEAEGTRAQETEAEDAPTQETETVRATKPKAEPYIDPCPEAHPIVEAGLSIRLTNYHGKHAPKGKNFRVGDTVKIEKCRKDKRGIVRVSAIAQDRTVTFDSTHYDWEIAQPAPEETEA
ncbi:MAG: hypothetical protein LUD17_16665 [Bacteroidales bacterium]|nr:hypothetical protein [Bacteroidales bacterium]